MRRGLPALLIALILSWPSDAADRSGIWHGPGAISCVSFVEHREAHRDNAFRWWMFGWIAAHNKLLDNTYALIADEESFEQAIIWIDVFCRAHPDQTFVDAAVALTDTELYPKRLIAKPH